MIKRTPDEFATSVVNLTEAVVHAKESNNKDDVQDFQDRLNNLISSSTDLEQLKAAFQQLNAKVSNAMKEDLHKVSNEFLETTQDVLMNLTNNLQELHKLQNPPESPTTTILREIQNVGHALASLIEKSNPDEVKQKADEGAALLSQVDVDDFQNDDLKDISKSVKEAVKPAVLLKELFEKKFGKESPVAKSLSSFVESAKSVMAKIGEKILPKSIQEAMQKAKAAKEAAHTSTAQQTDENKDRVQVQPK